MYVNFFILLMFIPNFFIFSCEVQRSEAPIILQWISDSDLAREEKIFVRSFLEVHKNFYTKLGFKECEYVHEGLDPKKYVGYELAVEEKENLSRPKK